METSETQISLQDGADITSPGGAAGAAGVVGAAGATGGMAGAESKPKPLEGLEAKGYFNLQFSTAQAILPTGPGEAISPSLSTTLRIDLPEQPSKGPWLAAVTPRWGQPSVFEVTIQEEGLLLTGSTSLSQVSPKNRVTDVWQSLTLELKNKRLTGKVNAEGQESLFQEQIGWSGRLLASGFLSPDTSPPEAEMILEEGNPRIFPWQPLRVIFSEPLKPNEVLNRLVLRDGEENIAVSWSISKEGVDGSVGGVLGYRQSWDSVDGFPTLLLKNGFRDPALNEGVGFEQKSPVEMIPNPNKEVVWGDNHQILWGDAKPLAVAGCEGKSCLELGPFPITPCGLLDSGVALRVLPPPGSKLKLRYQVFLSVPSTTFANEMNSPPLLSLEVARPGSAAVCSEISLPAIEDGSGQGLLPFASPWTTLQVPVPEGNGEVGLALRVGGLGATKACSSAGAKAEGAVLARIVLGDFSFETP